MTGARARASCMICLPNGRAVNTQLALPPKFLTLSRGTKQRLRKADEDKEFIGILLSTIHEQMNTISMKEPKREKRKRAPKRSRFIVDSSPDRSPVKKVQRKKTPQKDQTSSLGGTPLKVSTDAARRVQSAFAKAQETSKALLSVTADALPLKKKWIDNTMEPEEGMGITLQSGRKVTLSGSSSGCNTPVGEGPSDKTAINIAERGPADGGPSPVTEGNSALPRSLYRKLTTIRAGCSTPAQMGYTIDNVADNCQGLIAAPDLKLTGRQNAIESKNPFQEPPCTSIQTVKASARDDDDYEITQSDSDIDEADATYEYAATSTGTSPMDIDAPYNSDLTSARKLEKDVAKMIELMSGAEEHIWADKMALVEWITAAQQKVAEHSRAELNGSPTPASRLENLLRHIPDQIASVDPNRWPSHVEKLKRFCNSAAIHNMGFEQRLMKIIDIIFLHEDIDAVANREWDRLERIAGLCSIIAEIIGPDNEAVDDETKNRWIAAKKVDIASLKRVMGAKSRVAALGM
ncbi:hypothetical protein QQS21_008240 [Conoideocrella luteorostrata]|uniref:Uncharacterized protein n=1 Tax=Conoideocrella luteorostrata TaxID=1105319 RepID=A0AAJ0CJK1_9HYPO|nr:hypothetical protein QQS21_008240 [Conoideocrella luteorostrata]